MERTFQGFQSKTMTISDKMGSSTYFRESHLKFERLPLENRVKMCKYKVINRHFNEEIGIIHWRGGWRQYVFQAKPEVDISRSCQRTIIEFIDKIMKEWKLSRL